MNIGSSFGDLFNEFFTDSGSVKYLTFERSAKELLLFYKSIPLYNLKFFRLFNRDKNYYFVYSSQHLSIISYLDTRNNDPVILTHLTVAYLFIYDSSSIVGLTMIG